VQSFCARNSACLLRARYMIAAFGTERKISGKLTSSDMQVSTSAWHVGYDLTTSSDPNASRHGEEFTEDIR